MAFGEMVAADEAERFKGFADEFVALQKLRAQKSGKIERAAHVKQHVGAVGELQVTAEGDASVGVFANAGQKWPVYARFSNGSTRRQSDKVLDARGFALKLVGVPGPKLIAGLENELTQDFLFIDTPTLPVRNPDEFMSLVRAAKDGPAKLLPRLVGSLGVGKTFALLKRTAGAPKVKSFATHTFHTAAPIAFGASAAKLALVPVGEGGATSATSGDDFLRDDLIARLKRGPLSWTLRAQLYVDQTSTPIEDTFVVWNGPWHDVARLTLPQQDPESARGLEISQLVSELSFDPWHAGEQHRPLGAIMRARGATYGASVVGRNAAPEPKSVLAL